MKPDRFPKTEASVVAWMHETRAANIIRNIDDDLTNMTEVEELQMDGDSLLWELTSSLRSQNSRMNGDNFQITT